ncbi:hypothetical protein [Streptomyces nojiriensis]|uniref:hypothetical protein n=1 Tax=Streptomyces nojiriensis TaxID=66374 RepID=UPI0035DD20D3
MSVLFFDVGATLANVTFEDDGSSSYRPRARLIEAVGSFAPVCNGITVPGAEPLVAVRRARPPPPGTASSASSGRT